MRYLALDTETTGISTKFGHRIIEIGMMDVSGRKCGETWQRYLQPDREIDEGAIAVHGITQEFLADKPRFEDIADELLTWLQGATLIIHNAKFDLGFLEYEFKRLKGEHFNFHDVYAECIDTLTLARKKYPGQRNSLDALCGRLQVDNSGRELHGALLDAELLAGVYLRMTGGQNKLTLNQENVASAADDRLDALQCNRVTVPSAEVDDHQQYLAEMKDAGQCIWLNGVQVTED